MIQIHDKYMEQACIVSRESSCLKRKVGAVIMIRGNNKEKIFKDDEDKREYLKRMAKYKRKYQCGILAYCLMDTHVP